MGAVKSAGGSRGRAEEVVPREGVAVVVKENEREEGGTKDALQRKAGQLEAALCGEGERKRKRERQRWVELGSRPMSFQGLTMVVNCSDSHQLKR